MEKDQKHTYKTVYISDTCFLNKYKHDDFAELLVISREFYAVKTCSLLVHN